jgi:hypothetical protein
MVTEEMDIQLPWHFFLEKEEMAADALRNRHLHIEAFRRNAWSSIRRYLDQDYDLVVPDGLEPHWVDAGKAIYWQEQVTRQPIEYQDSDGRTVRVMEEVSYGWHPTKPLPASNASIMAHYLDKGLRLRPPSEGLAVEVSHIAEEAAALSEGSQDEPHAVYWCLRHSTRGKSFSSWKAYIAHCARYQESPIEEPPDDVRERMKESKFYCFIHDKGFSNLRSASRHHKVSLRRPGRAVHPSVQEMEVN